MLDARIVSKMPKKKLVPNYGSAVAGSFIRESEKTADGSTWEIKVIKAGPGSSGYYPESVLERDLPTAFPAGTKMFLNHDSFESAMNGGDLARLMGITTSPVEWRAEESAGYAKVRIGSRYRDIVEEFYDVIGVSINTPGSLEDAMEGVDYDGPIISALENGPYTSIDAVVAPGAGGKFERMLEAAATVIQLHEDSAPAADNPNNGKESHMEIEDVERVVEAAFAKIEALLTPITESLKPEEKNPADVADAIEVATEKAIEAKLPKLLRKAVIEQVKANPEADVDKLVTEAKSFRDEVVTESADTTSTGNVREAAGKGEAVGSLSLFARKGK